jgi:hypothetical protein
MIEGMSPTLTHHWKESLHSGPDVCAKVFRFLLQVYGDQAIGIAFPTESPEASACRLEVEVRPGLPRSSEQIRSLLVRISESVRVSLERESR